MKRLVWLALVLWLTGLAGVWAQEIPTQQVKSSLISEIGYREQDQTLLVRMVNNSETYLYHGVPQAIYDGLLDSDSKGTYFVQFIKGKFDSEKAQ